MTALLYLDLLGVRARWHADGRSGVDALVGKFRDIVIDAATKSSAGSSLRGGLEADSLALVCPTAEVALDISRQIYRDAFMAPTRREHTRLWIRGVVTPYDSGAELRVGTAMEGLTDVQEYRYSDALLDAIAVERSGVKGMRILVANNLVTSAVRRRYRSPVGKLFIIPFKKLNSSAYPLRVGSDYQDYLWMASADGRPDDLLVRMEQRLRWASRDSEEFLQAAATQVVFHEFKAIHYSVERHATNSR